VRLTLLGRLGGGDLKMGWFGVVRGDSRSLEIAPFDRAHMSSY